MYFQLLYNIQLYKNLFTNPTVGGHLSCFQFEPIINNTTMNILVHTSRCTYACISLRYIPWTKILGSGGMCLFNFIGCHMVFSERLCQFTVPPAVFEGDYWSIFSPKLNSIRLLIFLQSHSYVSHCSFNLYFPNYKR